MEAAQSKLAGITIGGIMFDAEAKFAALERRVAELERLVAELKRKQRGPVASSGDPLPNSGGGPGEEDTPGP